MDVVKRARVTAGIPHQARGKKGKRVQRLRGYQLFRRTFAKSTNALRLGACATAKLFLRVECNQRNLELSAERPSHVLAADKTTLVVHRVS